jgi:hypothetical protein
MLDARLKEHIDFLVECQLWLPEPRVNVHGWLQNFQTDEIPFAAHILESFRYVNEITVREMLRANYERLSSFVTRNVTSTQSALDTWAEFLSNAIWTYISGEQPNASDSGYSMVRLARQELGVPESRIMQHTDLARELTSLSAKNIIFLDDLVGTGNQCIATWRRPLTGTSASFASLAAQTNKSFFYLPLVCTTFGMSRIHQHCSELVVMPTHTVSEDDSLFANGCSRWPSHLRSFAEDKIREISQRAGIPDTNGTTPEDWRGFGKLGLTIAFHHSVPDASIPLLYWDKNGWIPLVRRT